MCPECFASIALLVTGIVSTGGVAAVSATLFRKKKRPPKVYEVQNQEDEENSK
jgi:hypothetical protein